MVCFLAPTTKSFSPENYSPLSSSMGKRATTYLGYTLLTVASLVETAVFSLFSLFCVAVFKPESRPYQVFTHLLQRSAFFTTWSSTHLFLRLIPFVSQERKDTVACKLGEKFLPPHDLVQEGADFLVNYVLKGLSGEDVEEFETRYGDIFTFIATRAAYFYAWGEKRKEPVPHFFGAETKQAIEWLRTGKFNVPIPIELTSLQKFIDAVPPASPPSSPVASSTTPVDSSTTPVDSSATPSSSSNFLWLIKNAANPASNSSLLISHCWSKAIHMISPQNTDN